MDFTVTDDEFREVAPALDSPRKEGDTIWSYCPAHDDKPKPGGGRAGRNLSYSPQHGLKCWSGCQFKDIMRALRARLGNRASRTYQASSYRERATSSEPTVVYDYRDPYSGEIVAYKGRFETIDEDGKPDKRFLWRLPEGTWKEGIKAKFPNGVSEMPLLHADELLLLDDSKRVWFTEGEKACEAVRKAGEFATTGGWGASQSDFGDALALLQGRNVVLWPDNDKPGREYMKRVKTALRGIARSVVIVNAPVPPKGDAYEYFRAGGSIKKLLADVVTEPVVDVLEDSFRVRIPTEAGVMTWEFADVARSSRSLDADVTVIVPRSVSDVEYSQRVNVKSQSARATFRRELTETYGAGTANWAEVLSIAYSLFERAYRQADPIRTVAELPEAAGPEAFLIEDVLPLGEPTILFGDGSSGKTMVAYSMALAVLFGGAWLGKPVATHGPVLIVDYETGNGMTTRHRLARLLRGMGLDPAILPDLPIYFKEARGVPLVDLAPELRDFVREKDVQLVIVDAGGDACGGEPENAGTTLAYFNALARVGTTSITIHHTVNPDNPSAIYRPFGSRYWHNRARRTWSFEKAGDDGGDTAIEVLMSCRKSNGTRPKPMPVTIAFNDPGGPIELQAEPLATSSFDHAKPVRQRIIDHLAANGATTIALISKNLEIRRDTVEKTLKRGQQEGLFILNKQAKPWVWGLVD